MDVIALVATVVVAAFAGACLGFLGRGVVANQAIQSAQEKSARIVAEARTQQKELILAAKDEKMRLQREAEDEARAKRGELATLESRLLARDEQLDMRADMLEQRDRKILDREREFESARQELARAHQEHVAALERVSGSYRDPLGAPTASEVTVSA